MVRSASARVALAATVVALLAVVPGTAAGQEPPSVPSVGTDVTVEVLTQETQDPTAVDVTPDGRVVWTERTGRVKVWTPEGEVVEAGRIEVAANSCADCPDELEEGGLHGLLVDRDFATSKRVYLYYSVPGSLDEATGRGLWRLSTFVLGDDNTLDLSSEQQILDVPAEWANCCHYGGDPDWAPDGTIIMSTGDDTSPRDEGWNPRDRREGREAFNAERTSQNPADRRGKLLRFMPDGSVPDGSQPGIAPNPFIGQSAPNPYIEDTSGDPADGLIEYDPLVYATGFRSNYKIAVDPVTGATVVGNVGPDAYFPDETRGPRGHDEFEVVPGGGGTNHGWPRCIADNQPYRDYDYETGQSGELLACDGMTPAAIYYTYDPVNDFPTMLAGMRTALAGVVYRYDGDGQRALPDTYEGHALLFDWSRDFMWHAPVADDGSLDTGALTLSLANLRHPIDAATGPDGAVYLAEYGEFYYNNNTSRISRIVCNGCAGGETAGATSGAPGVTADVASGVLVFLGDRTSAVIAALAIAALAAVGIRRRRRTI